MAKIKLTSQEFADKHARRLKGSIDDIRAGVGKVTVAPTQLAAAKQDKMLQNLTAAVQSGKWASRLKSVDLPTWQDKIINKGLGRIASGIDGAHDKVVAFADQLLPYEATLQDQVAKMPDLTLEDSVNRASSWIRGMSKFTRK
jgi:hypothetical protein